MTESQSNKSVTLEQLAALNREIAALMRAGAVRIAGAPCRPNTRVAAGDIAQIEIPEAAPATPAAEPIALAVLYEDADIVVIDKQPGLVVHPAAGHPGGTLVNALLHHCADLRGVGGELRPGIVHRLDKDTSGVIVVAKHEQALAALAGQFKARQVDKVYVALVRGAPRLARGSIAVPIGRSRHDRKRMSTATARGRDAVTRYEVAERFGTVALLRVRIETGRTHQIRVHLAHIGHPVLGDAQYGGGRDACPGLPVPAPRQMLHAAQLTLRHPVTDEPMTFVAPLPDDMQRLLDTLRAAVEQAVGIPASNSHYGRKRCGRQAKA